MARNDPQVNFRMPQELRDKLEAAAKANNRTLTAEIVARLQDSFVQKHASFVSFGEGQAPEWAAEIKRITEEASRKGVSEEFQKWKEAFDKMLDK